MKYNEIITTEGKENIKTIIDEIIQQYFGFYFNGYFMSYYEENNYNIQFLKKHKLFLLTCIEFLESLEESFKGRVY